MIEKIRSIINMFPHATLVLNKVGRCLIQNDQLTEVTGIEPAKMVDFGWCSHLLEIGTQFEYLSKTKNLTEERLGYLELQRSIKIGKSWYILDISLARPNPYFEYLATLIKKPDIPRNKIDRDMIHFKDLYNNLPVMSVCVDHLTGQIIECNNTACAKLGYTREELVGQPVFFVYSEQGQLQAKECFDEFYNTGVVVNKEVSMACKNGQTFEAILNVNSVRDQNNNIIHSRSTWLDISELRRAERTIKETQDQLIQSAKLASIGELSSGIAHELNNPLMYILGNAQLEIENGVEALDVKSAYDSFERIINGAKRM